MKHVLAYLLLLTISLSVFGQEVDSIKVRNKNAEKKWTLTFRSDLSLRPILYGKSTRIYNGEFFNPSINEWTRKDETIKKDFTKGNFKNRAFQLDVLLSPNIKGLNLGLSYNFLNFSSQTETYDSVGMYTLYTYEDVLLFSIGGIVDYTYEFTKPKNLFLSGSIGLAAYQSDELYSGPGKELVTDTRLAVGYFIGGRFGVRTYVAHNYALYRETENSEFFNGQQNKVKFDLSHVQFGIGLSYRFFMVPD